MGHRHIEDAAQQTLYFRNRVVDPVSEYTHDALYQLVRATALPEVNPLNPKYALFIRAWRRLPLPLANLLGPHIVRQLG